MTEIQLPDALPMILLDHNIDLLKNKLCYIYRLPELTNGISIVVTLTDTHRFLRISDFTGKIIKNAPIDTTVECKQVRTILINGYINKIVDTMRLIKLNKAIYYFTGDVEPLLMDIRMSINKFASSGFIEDIFGKQGIPILNRLCDPITLDDKILDMVVKGDGVYGGNLLIKPSVFKFIVKDDQVCPLYKVVKREIKSAS